MLSCVCILVVYVFFFFKQKTAYEMRISDWSSDVCSADLRAVAPRADRTAHFLEAPLQHGTVQVGLRPEEIAGCAAGDAGERAHVAQAGGGVAALGEAIGRASWRERGC